MELLLLLPLLAGLIGLDLFNTGHDPQNDSKAADGGGDDSLRGGGRMRIDCSEMRGMIR